MGWREQNWGGAPRRPRLQFVNHIKCYNIDANRIAEIWQTIMRTRTYFLKTWSSVPVLALMLVIGPLLSACDQNEQGRIRSYEKGTYLGQPDTPLTEEARAELRARARLQAQ
jgi:hypothetical protein